MTKIYKIIKTIKQEISIKAENKKEAKYMIENHDFFYYKNLITDVKTVTKIK